MFNQTFEPLAIADIPAFAQARKAEGWRYVQTLAVNTEDGIDVIYSFMKDGNLVNSQIKGVQPTDVLPSITNEFLAAFVFENEVHDLFGVNIEGIAIDFGGNFYVTAQQQPMTIISPEQKAAREKAKKVAAAKAAKEKAAAAGKTQAKAAGADADMEAKLAGMDPAKAAKVRAAMEAKAKKEAAAKAAEKDAAMEAKLAGMDPAKAAKVRAAMEAKAKKEAAAAAQGQVTPNQVLASPEAAQVVEAEQPIEQAMATEVGEVPTTAVTVEEAEALAAAVNAAKGGE